MAIRLSGRQIKAKAGWTLPALVAGMGLLMLVWRILGNAALLQQIDGAATDIRRSIAGLERRDVGETVQLVLGVLGRHPGHLLQTAPLVAVSARTGPLAPGSNAATVPSPAPRAPTFWRSCPPM